MCGPARWSFVRDRFVDNVAAGFGGVLAWNVNDDQSFSPCHFCGAEYTAWSTSAVCDIKVCSPVSWSLCSLLVPSVRSLIQMCAPLVCVCVCVCVVQGNVAGEARDVVQSPLIDSIFVSSSQWMERTSPDTSVPLRANSTILQLDARSLLVRVETGNCSRTIEEMRVPVIEVRCDSLRGALMPVDATLTHPIPCLSVRQSHQPAVGHHRDRFLPTKLH